eukprot:TRINITY_DN679_c0_g1_i1.p1 TRINITY_DN679_c0_g1~~TRINITY_DN679_c0_g1_i1.p1  ORF type:complete len:594 (+),score=149.04 TRINITY_DN679_c0_g1_i1:76-1782(+)
MPFDPLTSPQWAEVEAAKNRLKDVSMRSLFESDAQRFDNLSFKMSLGGSNPDDFIFLDFSKNLIDAAALTSLLSLIDAAGTYSLRDAMFAGERINTTENRSVLHVALREQRDVPTLADGVDVQPEVRAVRARMEAFAAGVRDGSIAGSTGKRFTHVVNIGIGGSDLGPVMVVDALRPYCRDTEYATGRADAPLSVRFVSNVDGAHLAATLADLDPVTTLFVVASKTFTTQETMTNAASARTWVATALGEKAVGAHFAAVSTNLEAVGKFGIPADRVFGFWDWVGGRYSLWSSIGLPIALAVGPERYEELLAGAHAVDRHFVAAPPERNLSVILAALGIWYGNFMGHASHALLPYSQDMRRFAAYFQQADMESNGKTITKDGARVRWETGPVVWGEPGTNGQHAFYQLLHQGSRIVPCDFIAAAKPQAAADGKVIGGARSEEHHRILLSNFIAQPEALMHGLPEGKVRAQGVPDALVPHKVFEGNRPSNSIVVGQLTPRVLGGLIAMYEHKIFVQGAVWGINSFDQWGVELGKVLAKAVLPEISPGKTVTSHDSSTRGIINLINRTTAA